jgi:hypothetical protein
MPNIVNKQKQEKLPCKQTLKLWLNLMRSVIRLSISFLTIACLLRLSLCFSFVTKSRKAGKGSAGGYYWCTSDIGAEINIEILKDNGAQDTIPCWHSLGQGMETLKTAVGKAHLEEIRQRHQAH